MELIWTAARVLAALELVPGDPADLTALLRDPDERRALLGPEAYLPAPTDADRDSFDMHARTDLGRYLTEQLDHGRVEAWAKRLERHIENGLLIPLIHGTGDYPERLGRVWDAPPILFRRLDAYCAESGGAATVVPVDDPGPAVAIVGARVTDAEVLAAADRVAGDLATRGTRIVSGLAAGVDTAAHVGALAAGGLTTAVLGTGVDHVYPAANTALAEEIACRGVVVSQFAPPAPRTSTTFLRRNCVIAALSDASLVMDAAEQSGSRHELEQALRYGKRVFMWRPTLRRSEWATTLERAGVATFVESAQEVLDGLQ